MAPFSSFSQPVSRKTADGLGEADCLSGIALPVTFLGVFGCGGLGEVFSDLLQVAQGDCRGGFGEGPLHVGGQLIVEVFRRRCG